MEKKDFFWQTYLMLEKEVINVAKYIYITDEINDNQLNVFSPHISDLLVRTCIEIEAISKELYFDFGGEKKRGNKTLKFDTECLKLIDMKCNTHKKVVIVSCPFFNLTKQENKSFRPLNGAHKGKTDWERSYQAVKHDRYSSVNKGTIKNLIHAMGALYLLNIYYRDVKLITKYFEIQNLDMSLGSSIFSVAYPEEKYRIDVVNNKTSEDVNQSESPFIFKLTDDSKRETLRSNNDIRKCILNQPEFQEELFKQILKTNDVNIIDELFKYRINKEIPNTLPFAERKNLFLASREWKKRREKEKCLSEDDITAENIQSEIDAIGSFWGIEFSQQIRLKQIYKALNEDYYELVIYKGKEKE